MAQNFTLSRALLVACVSSLSIVATAQTVVFQEDFGTPTSEKAEVFEDHEWGNNAATMFNYTSLLDGSGLNVRSNNPSDYEGASANGNLYFKGCIEFSIVGINTAGYNSMKLSFGAFGKNKDDVTLMKVDYAVDGGDRTALANFADLELDTAKKKWTKVEGLELPSGTTLDLIFSSNLSDLTADGGIRLDDIVITGETTDGITAAAASHGGVAIHGNTIKYLGSTGNAALYDIRGTKVADLQPGTTYNATSAHGIYIIKVGTQSKKVALR